MLGNFWFLYGKTLRHIIFWSICTGILILLFATSSASYLTATTLVLMLLPVHIAYYYTLNNLIIPKFLFKRNFAALIPLLLLTCIFYTCCYRLIEIFFADPYLFRELKLQNPGFRWKKLDGNFVQQFLNPPYLVLALEQTNAIVWGGLLIKFIGMWYDRKQMALYSELNFLKAQIHPHFLFNTLNNLYSLTLNNSPASPGIVLDLSQILRYMLYECNTDYVPLRKDIDIIKHYIGLEQLRYGDKLELNLNIKGEIKDQQIAPLLMIPLIENAFKHGASEMIEDAWINIAIEVAPSTIKLKVSNSKPLEPTNEDRSHFGKIGLQNVRKRLELIYPETHTLSVHDEEEMFAVILSIELTTSLLPAKNSTDTWTQPTPAILN